MNTALSTQAQLVYNHLVKTDGCWMDNLIEVIYPKPIYASNPEAQKAYWQWDVNMYGNDHYRPVAGVSVEFKATDNYSAAISKIYQELKAAGLAGERNNGYNEYFIYPKK